MRNDYHHVAFSDSCAETFTQLEDLLSYLDFLADYQLVRVESETRNRGTNRVLFGGESDG